MSDPAEHPTSQPPPRVVSDATSQPPPPTGPPLSLPAGPVPGPLPPGGALPPVTWGPARALGGLGFLVVLVLLLATAVAIFDHEIETLAAQVTLQALLAGSLIFTAFLFAAPAFRSGFASRDVLGLRRPRRKPVWLAVATYFGYVGCAIVISLLLAPQQKDITRDLGGDSGTAGTVIAGLLIVIVAPISEEIFFRGFLFGGMRRALPGPAAALIASAIWGLFHYTGPGTWGVVLQITVFGLWLSWLYTRTGSIYPTMAVHAINNAIAFAVLISS